MNARHGDFTPSLHYDCTGDRMFQKKPGEEHAHLWSMKDVRKIPSPCAARAPREGSRLTSCTECTEKDPSAVVATPALSPGPHSGHVNSSRQMGEGAAKQTMAGSLLATVAGQWAGGWVGLRFP